MTEKTYIEINLEKQTLCLRDSINIYKQYPVSTAKNGAGEVMDSECTPRGKHRVAEKIGASAKTNTVFVGRKDTGEIYTAALRTESPDRDWILTRILWLSGCESGQNQGANVDSYDRYIYIHGTPDDVDMNTPGSRGCVRMRNLDIIELFDLVKEGTEVNIFEKL